MLDDFTPAAYLDVAYPASHATVDLGNFISTSDAQARPAFELHPSLPIQSSESSYTLVLTDPDAPTRSNPSNGEFCHWIATNISGTSSNAGPDELIKYTPPAPPPGTGPHRYVLVLLQPKSGNEQSSLTPPAGRKRWGYDGASEGVRRWAYENGLEAVGKSYLS